MGVVNNLRRLLDRKEWEQMTPCPVSTVAGGFVITDPSGEDKSSVYIGSASAIYRYDHNQDAWQQLPASGLPGSFAAGSCGTFHHHGPSGVASNGSNTTLNTNLTINRSLKGYKIRITAGPGAGNERTILSNTLGVNSVITVSEAFSEAITSASNYLLLTGRYWFFNAGTSSVGFGYYDRALNTWTLRSVTGLPTAWGTDARLCQTYSPIGRPFASGIVSSATGTTLVNSLKNWAPGQWVNYQVRIVSGLGAGQTRVISSNNATTLTTPAWAITPDGTSNYVIEGNDNSLYLLGNNSAALYKYSISENTWATLSPAVARGGNFVAGGGANWASNVSDAEWNNENVIKNGRRIYSFRGSGAILDYYDIPTNSWVNLIYTPQVDTFSTGSCYDYDDDYIMISKENTGRIFRYIISENRLIPWSTILYPNSTAMVGDKMWTKVYENNGVSIKWVYHLLHNMNMLFRCMMIDID